MKLRKEQILFVIALLLGLWIWSGRGDFRVNARVAPKPLAWEGLPETPVVLADDQSAASLAAKAVFRPPSEASPLPPRELEFPPLATLPIVAPPLRPGQSAMAYDQLRIPGDDPVTHEFTAIESAMELGDEGFDSESQSSDSIPDEVLRQRYDQLYQEGHRNPFYGRILGDDKFDLVTATVIERDVEFEQVSRLTGRVTSKRVVPADQIIRLMLADNLENRIALRKRELPDAVESIPRRIQFIRDLLDEARKQSWVYAEAENQARKVAELSPPTAEVGYRWIARVLHAQADLGREWKFYHELPPSMAESSFRYLAQGQLAARLTLWADAERDLKRAVELAPTNARCRALLARFLLGRGRAVDALPHAELAARYANQISETEDRFEILRVTIETQLALGRLDEAMEYLDRVSTLGDEASRATLRGAVHYARGELDEARAQFERAVADATALDAVLGLGVCRLRAGEWDQARADLLRVVEGAPLLRARALAALGLLYERCGHPGEALEALEDAERVDPRDPYVLYLLGRQLRIDGRYEESIEISQRALAEQDEMVEVLAEIARALIRLAEESEHDSAELQVRAARYIERLVELDQRRARYLPYVEAQGYVLARIGDVNTARESFEEGAEVGSEFCELGLALLDYRQQRVTDARERLASIAGDPARIPETREFARETMLLIDDHASKEQIRDSFDREQLGGLWQTAGALEPDLVDQALVYKGQTGRVGDESLARRVLPAGDLLRAEVSFRVLGELASTQLLGLRITREGKRDDFQVFLGVQRQRPELYIKDGRPRDGEVDEPVPLDGLSGLDLSEPQRLVFELIPGEEDNRMALRLYWNDELVAEREAMRQLNQRSTWNLQVDLVVRGRPVHVAFDDFRLVRRKEIR